MPRGPLQGVQFGPYPTDQGTPDANFGAAVDGNYGFGDGCFDGTLDANDPANPVCDGGEFSRSPRGDYLVDVGHRRQVDDAGDPMYKVTREEDINIGNGDQFVPQVPPPACAGALHTVDVAGMATLTGDLESVRQRRPTRLRRRRPRRDGQPDLRRHRRLALRGHAASRCATPSSSTLQNGKSIVPDVQRLHRRARSRPASAG